VGQGIYAKIEKEILDRNNQNLPSLHHYYGCGVEASLGH
jgi:hypothetical protein